MRIQNLRKLIVKYSKYLVDKNYIGLFDGNISCRLEEDKILITPTRKNKLELLEKDLVLIDLEGKKLSGKNCPSGEWKLHCMIYKKRQDINAVVHTHPIFTTAFSITNFDVRLPILAETVNLLDKVKYIKYIPFYSVDLVKNIEKYIIYSDIFILRNHGLVSIAKDLEEAVYITEKIENLAKVVFISHLVGKEINKLSKKQIKEIFKLNKT